MFDSMELEEACSDIYDCKVNDDHLSLLYESSNVVKMAVKTPYGQSKEYTLSKRIMQGDTFGPVLASCQVDIFGKQMLEELPRFMYRFKGEVPIPPLGMVDDLLGWE